MFRAKFEKKRIARWLDANAANWRESAIVVRMRVHFGALKTMRTHCVGNAQCVRQLLRILRADSNDAAARQFACADIAVASAPMTGASSPQTENSKRSRLRKPSSAWRRYSASASSR